MPRGSAKTSARTRTKKAVTKKAGRKRAVAKPARKTAGRKAAATRRRTPRQSQGKMLSKTTTKAKWIESVEEHEDRPGQSLATRSHDVIMKWAQDRGAEPSLIESTRTNGKSGVLRLNFPGFSEGKALQKVSWDEWFSTFDNRKLVFIFQEHMKKGNPSNFFRLDSPEREQA